MASLFLFNTVVGYLGICYNSIIKVKGGLMVDGKKEGSNTWSRV